jgi:hypothetical protein
MNSGVSELNSPNNENGTITECKQALCARNSVTTVRGFRHTVKYGTETPYSPYRPVQKKNSKSRYY